MKTVEDLSKELTEVEKEIEKADTELAKWRSIQRKLHEKKTSLTNSIVKLKTDSLAKVDWSGSSYQWSKQVETLLHTIFKIDSFRPQQLSAINSTLYGQHAIVVMPTGAGKSLCYQLPALVNPGITVVVSPLVSLMEDQVRSLTKINIPAILISASSPKENTMIALNALKEKSSTIKLIYATPERFAKSKRFMANLQKCFADGRLQRIAIDEVHCCSQWGHDFRPDYKFLGILANMFHNVPILGLTATATANVLTDVQKILNISGCLVIKSTFNRPNLFYKILEKPTSQDECLNILEKLLKYRYKDETGLIYTNSIRDCEELALGLRKRGLKVACYHATLPAEQKSKVHKKWHEKSYQAIVATVAFGMGIDKPDVRFVIHHTISKSMENYYQESGRAGRDGQRAECITLYRMQDIFKVSTMVFSSVGDLDHLYGMVKYCLNGTQCRRELIATHFDEDWGNADCSKMCDVCSNENPLHREISLETHCKTLASILDNAEKQDMKLTAQKILDAWFCKGPLNLRQKGQEPNFNRHLGEDILAFLLVMGFLVEDFVYTAYTTISYIKKGPNMDWAFDEKFELKMPVRKYTQFDLETPAPSSFSNVCLKSMENINSIEDITKSSQSLQMKKKSEAAVTKSSQRSEMKMKSEAGITKSSQGSEMKRKSEDRVIKSSQSSEMNRKSEAEVTKSSHSSETKRKSEAGVIQSSQSSEMKRKSEAGITKSSQSLEMLRKSEAGVTKSSQGSEMKRKSEADVKVSKTKKSKTIQVTKTVVLESVMDDR